MSLLPLVRRRLSDESGVSLVELLVVMVLLPIVSGLVLTGFVAASRATTEATDRVTALTDLQRSVERVGRELRSGVPVSLTANTATVDVFRNGQRQRYSWTVTVAGALTQTRSVWNNPAADPTVTAPNSTGTTTLATQLTNLQTVPTVAPFAYFDQNRTPCSPTPCAQIDRVLVTLIRAIPDQPPITVKSEADFRNVNLNEA